MKILVGQKRVMDYSMRVQVKHDDSGVVTVGVKLSANPLDDIALKEALRIHEKSIAEEVIVGGIGPADLTADQRNGLAMGANRAIHVVTSEAVQLLTPARVFLKLIEKEQPGLVALSKQAIDYYANQAGQMLAALWNRPRPRSQAKSNPAPHRHQGRGHHRRHRQGRRSLDLRDCRLRPNGPSVRADSRAGAVALS